MIITCDWDSADNFFQTFRISDYVFRHNQKGGGFWRLMWNAGRAYVKYAKMKLPEMKYE